MRRPLALLFALVLVASLGAGCGGGEPDADGETFPVVTTDIRVYWLLDGKVWPVRRDVPETDILPEAALGELLVGPNVVEIGDLDMETAIPDDWHSTDLSVADGVATVELTGDGELSAEARAQVVYTLTQFPEIQSVRIGGRKLTRARFEDQTPPVLVESPLPFEQVGNIVRAHGTANTFEATFHYELTDTDGRIVDDDFVTATSGTGTRGTFELTTDRFNVPFDGVGALIVFELSAEDGSRVNVVEIPLRMTR